jgi:hypothetical protein
MLTARKSHECSEAVRSGTHDPINMACTSGSVPRPPRTTASAGIAVSGTQLTLAESKKVANAGWERPRVAVSTPRVTTARRAASEPAVETSPSS